MKVVAINGSPKKEGNTYHALKKTTDTLNALGIETEIIHIGAKEIRGCMACGACAKGNGCAFADDFFNEVTKKMYEADGLIIGSPVYYAAMAGTLKSFLDRAFYSSGGKMAGKIGAGIAVCRRTGGMTTFEQLNAYFFISQMTVASSFYWNVAHGRAPGEVVNDAEAMAAFEQLASNMAWLLKMKQETKNTIELPKQTERVFMNFIR